MDLGLDPPLCYGRAKEAVARGTDTDVRYACLELRFCLEALTYKKLQEYSDRVPLELLRTWQPRTVMRALLEREPEAMQKHTTRIFQQEPDGARGALVFEGRQVPLTLETVTEYYDRLGSYLHVPTVAKQRDPKALRIWYDKLRSSLNDLVTALEPVVASTFSGHIGEVFTFDCLVCNKPTIINAKVATARRIARCVHCEAEHRVRVHDDGTPEFSLDTAACDCQQCGAVINVPVPNLKLGATFECKACGARHVIHSHVWGCSLASAESSSEDTAHD